MPGRPNSAALQTHRPHHGQPACHVPGAHWYCSACMSAQTGPPIWRGRQGVPRTSEDSPKILHIQRPSLLLVGPTPRVPSSIGIRASGEAFVTVLRALGWVVVYLRVGAMGPRLLGVCMEQGQGMGVIFWVVTGGLSPATQRFSTGRHGCRYAPGMSCGLPVSGSGALLQGPIDRPVSALLLGLGLWQAESPMWLILDAGELQRAIGWPRPTVKWHAAARCRHR